MTTQMKTHSKKSNGLIPALWVGAFILGLAFVFVFAVYSELTWAKILVSVLLVADLGLLVKENRNALKSRSAAYGANSAVTIALVVGIVGVLNFLASRYPAKMDLTKNKTHTLSDQTVKLVKGLSKPVKATLFAKLQQRDQFQPLLDNYKSLNPKFEVEYVDPDREPTRAKQVGIKRYGTLQLVAGPRDSKIEEPTEEKLTNALIKILKEKTPTLCAITGHGEKSFGSEAADGFSAAKKELTDQAYDVKDVNIVQENRVPPNCDAIAILGANRAFFDPEIKAISDYLMNGGRAVVALDIDLKGQEHASKLNEVLSAWHIKPVQALIVDPLSKMLGVDASVPILASFSKESPITKDFQNNCYFPFARPLEVIPGAPPELNVQWIAQTTPKSWAVMDLSTLQKGEIAFREGKDKMGPINVAIAVDGKKKDSKAPRATRIVAFGTSQFAANQYARFGGDMDFFMNAVSWLLEDENLISIRAKEDGPGKIELSQKMGTSIFLLTVFAIPALIVALGIGIWAYRRRL